MKRFAGTFVVLGLLGIVIVAFLWWLPANDFVFVPDRAKPLADRVTVAGSRPAARGDVYYVEVFIRRLRLLERIVPFTRPEGATTVPERRYLPQGTSLEQLNRENELDMERSEKIASVVALRALGYHVRATPRGALVTNVFTDAPAAGKLHADDVIVAVDGVPVRTPDELRSEIGRRKPGNRVRLTVRREGKALDVTLRTVPSPAAPERPIVGITVDQDAKIELPFAINIDLGDVGGPSAGLPFALEIARKLGRDVTHGCKVAATGELLLDGAVAPIGAIEQKTIGARRAGVDIFVVPAGRNAAVAQTEAHGMRILPVESFQQAFRTLTTSRLKC